MQSTFLQNLLNNIQKATNKWKWNCLSIIRRKYLNSTHYDFNELYQYNINQVNHLLIITLFRFVKNLIEATSPIIKLCC